MPDPEKILSTFNFEVLLQVAGGRPGALVQGAGFSEVSGLQINLEVTSLTEGGFNAGVRQLVGKASHPTIVLKRGLTNNTDFWDWIQRCLGDNYPLPYCDGRIVQYPGARRGESESGDAPKPVNWTFSNGVVTQVKASDLNAGDGAIAIEELHINHEGLVRS